MEGALRLTPPPTPIEPLEGLLRVHVFPSFPSLEPADFLPLTSQSISSFPERLLPLLHEDYLPSLSKRFSDGAHQPKSDEIIKAGIVLLALYLAIYPRNYPLVGALFPQLAYKTRLIVFVGVHATEVAKVAWNVYILSGSTAKEPLLLIKAVSDFAKGVIRISLVEDTNEDSGPQMDVVALTKALEDEMRVLG